MGKKTAKQSTLTTFLVARPPRFEDDDDGSNENDNQTLLELAANKRRKVEPTRKQSSVLNNNKLSSKHKTTTNEEPSLLTQPSSSIAVSTDRETNRLPPDDNTEGISAMTQQQQQDDELNQAESTAVTDPPGVALQHKQARPRRLPSVNLVHLLFRRSLTGAPISIPLPRTALSGTRIPMLPFKVHSCSFNAAGDLLAVAHAHSRVSIFDWDAVCCFSWDARRNGVHHGGTTTVPSPLLSFPIAGTAVLLEWNPHQPNEVVVGCRNDTCLRLYDLEVVNGWIEERRCNNNNNSWSSQTQPQQQQPPCRKLHCHRPGARQLAVGGNVLSAASHCLFLDHQHVVVSAGNAVMCWKMVSSWRPDTIHCLWTFPYSEIITAMQQLNSDCLLLGSSTGRLAILDWKHLQRSAFATTLLPVIQKQWRPHVSLQVAFPQHEATAMGICLLKVSNVHGYATLTWLTNCGWVLRTTIDAVSLTTTTSYTSTSAKKIGKDSVTRVLYQTQPVEFVNPEGNSVSAEPFWSIPSKRIPASCVGGHFLWKRVPDNIRQTLEGYDLRVLNFKKPLPQKPSKPSLYWMDLTSRQMRKLPLPKQAGSPTCLTFHCSQEWVGVGTCHGFYILNQRTKCPS